MTEAMLFAAATEIRSAAERAAYLDQACGNDASLRRRIDELLVAHQVAGGFLEEPANAVNQAQSAEAWPTLEPRPAARDTEGAGSMIGRYKLLQQIGEGGFGAVWLAEQRQPVKRKAALKIIKLGMDTKQVIARFEAERQALAMMDHPNIAKVLDAGATESGRPYFVMELVKGVPITEYCDTNNLATVDRLALFVSVCHAIQHAHQKGIIHRDIKPSNILVTLHDGVPVPKVIDFGIAKATNAELTEKTLFTEHRQMIGTPAYMSPEQAEMSGLDIDTRSDIYSLGVLLYELLTGTTPFDAAELKKAGLAEIQRIIREDDPPRPSTRVSTMGNQALTPIAKNRATEPRKLSMLIRGDLDWIVMKALEKDRTRRYETANSLAMDIKRHLNDEAVTASPPGKLYKFRKTVRRNKLVFSAVGGVAVALVLGLVMSLWQAGRAEREANRAQREAQRASAALDDLRASAPAFAEQARGLAAMERFGEAIEKLDYAAKLRPDVAEYILAKADLLRCQLRLTDAAQTYRAALKIKPDLARAKADAELCDQLLAAPEGAGGKLTRESLSRLNEAMIKEQRPAVELMQVARLLGDEKKLIVDYWLARLKTLPISPDKPLDKRLTVRDDGLLALDLSKTKITDLAALEGMPMGALDLSSCDQVTDLTPLHDMPLKELILNGTRVANVEALRDLRTLERLELYGTSVSDLSPLRGQRLQKLMIRDTTITDLTPLSGMPLKELDVTAIPAVDFSVLAGMPLEQCILQVTRVRDLSFLRGAPLKILALDGCVEVRNLKVLSDVKTLEILFLPLNFADLPPEEIAAIEALRTHPGLKQIATDFMPGMNFSTAQSKELFWKDWDRMQAFAAPLLKSGITFSRYKVLDGTWSVTISKQPMTDLSMFKEMPISYLSLDGCKLGKDVDLTPLASMPLTELILNNTAITDLGPLRGLKLERLELMGTQVADLAPLKGMPLKMVDLRECKQVKEAAPLAELPALEEVLLPSHVTDLEPLRKLPHLKHISFNRGPEREPFACTAAEFWKTWDGLPWARKLEAAGIAFSFEQSSGGFYDVTVHDRKLTDVAIFKGSNVRRLYIGGSGVTDLSPLADLPLAVLSVGDTSVADLSALRSPVLRDALREIRLGRTKASDYSPIAACVNLETLDASDSTLKDLSVLTGMKLRTLKLGGTAVTDIAPVAGMPLETVYLAGTKVTDLSPLLKCPTLKSLLLPEDVRDFESLRALPKLTRISYTEKGGEPDKTAGQFWDDNKEQPWLAALRETKLTYKTRVLKDGSWELILDHQPITDLAMLKGARITRLSMSDAPVADLSPLRGMKLAYLRISSTKVTDLSPIRGMPITNLTMTKTNVRDLTPLVGMPLRGLYMGDCAQVTDLSPLTEMKTLDTITLPPAAKNIEFLRKFPILKRIGFAQASSQTADDFWADYDRKAEAATKSATTKPTAD